TESPCGLAGLGMAIVNVVSGNREAALTGLASIANTDPAFARSNLPLFRGVVATQQIEPLIDAARTGPQAASSVDLANLLRSLLSDETPPSLNEGKDIQSSSAETR